MFACGNETVVFSVVVFSPEQKINYHRFSVFRTRCLTQFLEIEGVSMASHEITRGC